MQFSNTNIIRTIVAILLQLSCCLSSYAIDDPTLTQPLLGSSGQVFVNATSTVTDQPNPFLTVENTFIVKNIVAVGIEEESKFFIQSDFKATVKLHIIQYNEKMLVEEEFDKEFTIDYKKAEGVKYNSNHHIFFKNAYKVKITIVIIDKNVCWDVTK